MDAKYIKAMKPRDLTEEEKQRPYAKTVLQTTAGYQ